MTKTKVQKFWELALGDNSKISTAAKLALGEMQRERNVLLEHMDTIMRCTNDPAIYNLTKVVIERSRNEDQSN